jgi:hypothetical protein
VKAKHAADIRKGIIAARRIRSRSPYHIATIYNTRYYSWLAIYALDEYRRRHPAF